MINDLENLIYFKICCGINTAIRFLDNGTFVLLESGIRGDYAAMGDILTLTFSDGTKDVFDTKHPGGPYPGNCDVGGNNGALLYHERLKHSTQEPTVGRFGICIGTYASLPFIHLQLETARQLYPSARILVVDDASGDGDRLADLCAKYNSDFISSPVNLGHMRGDVYAFTAGIKWAKGNNLTHLWKLSRRFVPKIDILQSAASVLGEGWATYSNTCDWGLRSECVLMSVSHWHDHCIGSLDDYVKYSVRDGLPHQVPEVLLTKLCKRFYYSISKNNNLVTDLRQSEEHIKRGCIFGLLPFLNNDRGQRSANYLWHSCNTRDDFSDHAKRLGLEYHIDDFGCVNPGSH